MALIAAEEDLPSSSVSPMEATGAELLEARVEYRMLSVSGPALPSSHRPCFFWKALTA